MKSKTCCKCGIIFLAKNGNVEYCLDCKSPSVKCPHGTKKGRCKIDGCFGNEICEHKNHNQKCPICKPGVLEADKLNKLLFSLMNGKKIREASRNFILEHIGMDDIDEVKEYFTKKLEGLNISKCHLDHIKPKSKFDLSKELNECCNYSNLQFINKKDNLKKNNKWTDENELYWIENIKNKKNYSIILF